MYSDLAKRRLRASCRGPIQLVWEHLTSCFKHLWDSNIAVLAVNKLEFWAATVISQNQQGGFAITKHFPVITVFLWSGKCSQCTQNMISFTKHWLKRLWSWKVPPNSSGTTSHFTNKETEADRGQMTCPTSGSYQVGFAGLLTTRPPHYQALSLPRLGASHEAIPVISYSKIPRFLTQKELLFLLTYLRAVSW